MAAKNRFFLAGLDVPESNAAVVATGGQGFPVRRKGDRPGFLGCVSTEGHGVLHRL